MRKGIKNIQYIRIDSILDRISEFHNIVFSPRSTLGFNEKLPGDVSTVVDDFVAIVGNRGCVAFIKSERYSQHGLVLYDGKKLVCEWVISMIRPSKQHLRTYRRSEKTRKTTHWIVTDASLFCEGPIVGDTALFSLSAEVLALALAGFEGLGAFFTRAITSRRRADRQAVRSQSII
jgi:hypothetical protein